MRWRWLTLGLLCCSGVERPSFQEPSLPAVALRCPGAPAVVIRLNEPTPSFLQAVATPEGFEAGGERYATAPRALEDVRPRLSVRDGVLYWDDSPLGLPEGTYMREVWEAARAGAFVVGIGRSSRTDAEARQTPPFFASEGFVFRPGDVRVLLSSPLGAFPSDATAFVPLRLVTAPP